MLFNTYQFLFFFPAFLLVHFLLKEEHRYLWILLCSLFFYACWNPLHLIYLFYCIVVSYTAGLLLEKRKQKPLLALFVLLDALPLLVFKYAYFVAENLARLLRLDLSATSFPRFLLPVGISFYTFQTLSYIVDVYRDDVENERSFLYYALFVSFFPQLVAGPIEHSKALLPQLRKKRPFDYDQFREGMLLMGWGMFLKIVIADRAARLIDPIYADYAGMDGIYLILGTVLFAFQLFCDFAGYSTIALGAARIIGITLTDNFQAPYLSTGAGEFWRRWHVSLGQWFKDYLYIPMGGSRKGRLRTCLNKFLVSLISGLWHGASWTFVAWGAINGLYQVIDELGKKPLQKIRKAAPGRVLLMILMFLGYCVSLVFFRSGSMAQGVGILSGILHRTHLAGLTGEMFTWGLSAGNLAVLAAAIGLLIFADVCKKNGICIRKRILALSTPLRWLVYLSLFLVLLIFGEYGENAAQFIYFVF